MLSASVPASHLQTYSLAIIALKYRVTFTYGMQCKNGLRYFVVDCLVVVSFYGEGPRS
jgi:hypothetical protein